MAKQARWAPVGVDSRDGEAGTTHPRQTRGKQARRPTSVAGIYHGFREAKDGPRGEGILCRSGHRGTVGIVEGLGPARRSTVFSGFGFWDHLGSGVVKSVIPIFSDRSNQFLKLAQELTAIAKRVVSSGNIFTEPSTLPEVDVGDPEVFMRVLLEEFGAATGM